MNRIQSGAMIFCLALVTLAFPPGGKSDEWDKRTKVTFSKPVEIPGVGAQVLPAGTYIFKLVGSSANRHIVQISNEPGDHVYATILAIPNYRLKSTDKTVMTFRERAAGEPQAIRAWFYPGNNSGQEFVYPKKRALALAKIANVPVLAMPDELATYITRPVTKANEPPVIALKTAPVEAVKPTGETVAMNEVVEAPPVEIAEVVRPNPQEREERLPQTARREERLPQTASLVPLVALIGLLSLFTGFALFRFSRRPVS